MEATKIGGNPKFSLINNITRGNMIQITGKFHKTSQILVRQMGKAVNVYIKQGCCKYIT